MMIMILLYSESYLGHTSVAIRFTVEHCDRLADSLAVLSFNRPILKRSLTSIELSFVLSTAARSLLALCILSTSALGEPYNI